MISISGTSSVGNIFQTKQSRQCLRPTKNERRLSSPCFIATGESGRMNNRRCSRASSQRTSPALTDRVTVNVSGCKYLISMSCLNQYPETLLGNFIQRNFYFNEQEKEYFFDRDPVFFKYIHKYYTTGQLHFPEQECHEAFLDELEFFKIDCQELSPCCFEPYAIHMERLEGIKKKNQNKKVKGDCKTLRESCWRFCNSTDTMNARIFYYISCFFILSSVVINCAETIPCATKSCSPNQTDRLSEIVRKNSTRKAVTSETTKEPPLVMMPSNCEESIKCGDAFRQIFFILDTICVTFFIAEYLFRLYGAPDRLKYVKSKMAIIDILSVVPYFFELVLATFHVSGSQFVNILRTLRVFRICKLVRHSKRLQLLTRTIAQSTRELGFILFIYFLLVIIFASIIYYIEKIGNDNSVFTTIPEAIWYTVVTTTTLGYGDVVPKTIQGKLVGSFCCLMGVLVIALPVPIIQMKASMLTSNDHDE